MARAKKYVNAAELIEQLESVGKLDLITRAVIGKQRNENIWLVYIRNERGEQFSDELIICAPNETKARKAFAELIPEYAFYGHRKKTEDLIRRGNTSGSKITVEKIEELTDEVMESTRRWAKKNERHEQRMKRWWEV